MELLVEMRVIAVLPRGASECRRSGSGDMSTLTKNTSIGKLGCRKKSTGLIRGERRGTIHLHSLLSLEKRRNRRQSSLIHAFRTVGRPCDDEESQEA